MINKLLTQLRQRPLFMKIAKGFGYAFLEKVIRVFLNIFVQFLMARMLGPSIYGEITLITKFIGMFMSILVFGLDELIVSEIVKQKSEEKVSSILNGIVGLRFLLGIVAYIGLVVFIRATFPAGDPLIWKVLLLGCVYFVSPLMTYELYFQRTIELHVAFRLRFASTLSIIGARIVGCLRGFTTSYFVGINVLEFFVLSFSFFISYLQRGKYIWAKPDFARAFQLWKSAIPLALSTFLLLIEQRYSLLLIEQNLSKSDLGVFSVSLTALDVMQYIPLSLGIASFPALVTMYSENASRFKNRIEQTLGVIFYIFLISFLGNFLLGRQVYSLLLGSNYLNLAELMSWAIFSAFFYSTNLIRVRWLTVQGKLFQWLIFSFISFTTSIFLQYQLIPQNGITGVYQAFLIAIFSGNILVSIFFKEFRETFWGLFRSPFSFNKGSKVSF